MDYALLKDLYFHPVTGRSEGFVQCHPDGQPWKKCCHGARVSDNPKIVNCAYVDKRKTKKDDLRGVITCTGESDKNATTQPFVCAHRTDDGYLRVCAGWHACHGNKND
jgi:hypothetical protein